MIPEDIRHLVDLTPEVADALALNLPCVALESTIITHGMPYPDNLAMSVEVEKVVTDQGAVAAPIAIIDGRIKIGLNETDRALLGQAADAMKVSRADLAFALAQGRHAGTTVAATMMIAAMAGISVFATGGIGGVHKGASDSFDVSADLTELGRTNVIVVAAGAKAILDVPKTMEVLETQGVPVVSYQTDVMPAFWSRESSVPVPLRLDHPRDIAAFQRMRRRFPDHGGMLVANPVPIDSEIPHEIMAGHIAAAQTIMDKEGVTGKAVTPYLLAKIMELTGGDSLKCNIALVLNNARLASQIAIALNDPTIN